MSDLIEQYLLQKDFLGFLQALYTQRIGEMFYVLIALIIAVPIYFRTQSLTYVSIILHDVCGGCVGCTSSRIILFCLDSSSSGNSRYALETFQVTKMDVSGLWSWLVEGIKKLIEGILKFLGVG